MSTPTSRLLLALIVSACGPTPAVLSSVEVIGHGGRITGVASSEAAGILCVAGNVGDGPSDVWTLPALVRSPDDLEDPFLYCESGPGRPLFAVVFPSSWAVSSGVGVFDDGVVTVTFLGNEVETPLGVYTGSHTIAFDATGAALWEVEGWVAVHGDRAVLIRRVPASIDSRGRVGADLPLPYAAAVLDDVVFDEQHVFMATHYPETYSPDIDASTWGGDLFWHADNPAPTAYTTVGGLALVDGRLFIALSHVDHGFVTGRLIDEVRAQDGTPSGLRVRVPPASAGFYTICALDGMVGVVTEHAFSTFATSEREPALSPTLTVDATGENTHMADCARGLDGDTVVVGHFHGLTTSFGVPLESGPSPAMYIARVR